MSLDDAKPPGRVVGLIERWGFTLACLLAFLRTRNASFLRGLRGQ